MADALSEDEILEAIARHLGRPGQGPRLRRVAAVAAGVVVLVLLVAALV